MHLVQRIVVASALLLMCASPAAAGIPRDWSRLDEGLDRLYLLGLYTYSIHQPEDASAVYRERVAYRAPVDSLGAEDYRTLDPASRDQRDVLAAPHRETFARTRLSVAGLFNASIDPKERGATAGPVFAGGAELFLDAVGALVNVTGLVPTDAQAWYDLAFLAGCLGDTRRQEAALDAYLELSSRLDPEDRGDHDPQSVRALLDKAWLARDRGDLDGAMSSALAARSWMEQSGQTSPASTREARLIAALAAADAGRTGEAHALAAPLDDMPYHERERQAHRNSPWLTSWKVADQIRQLRRQGGRSEWVVRPSDAPPPAQKKAWSGGTSDWARDWVHAVTWAREGDPERAIAVVGQPNARIEYPAHLNYRFWNDRGRIHEQAGQHDLAQRCYALATIHRPFFVYYPLEGRRGFSRWLATGAGGNIFFVGAGRFYTAGNLFAYGAASLLAWEFAAEDDPDRDELRVRAEEALTACRRRGIHATAALAQRGRLRYLCGDLARAGTDLRQAHEEMLEQDRQDPDLLLLLGLVHFNGQDYAGAGPWLEEYCRLQPTAGIGWRVLGLAAAHAGHLTVAEGAFGRAMEVEPGHAGGCFNRALVRMKLGDRAGAREDLTAAALLVPDHPDLPRLATALEEGPLPEVTLSASPVILRADQDQRVKFQRLRSQRLSVGAGLGGPTANTWMTEPDSLSLAALEDAYLHDPSPSLRTRLAAAHYREGEPRRVQQLLAPVWDTGASRRELLILLTADRELGSVDRARALVLGLQGQADLSDDPALWHLAGVICLDAGLEDLGAKALGHASVLIESGEAP